MLHCISIVHFFIIIFKCSNTTVLLFGLTFLSISKFYCFCLQADHVPEIEDDQPRNPFTELRLLSFHADIVHLLTIIDERR